MIGAVLIIAAGPPAAMRLRIADEFHFPIRQFVFLAPAILMIIGVSLLPPLQARRLGVVTFIAAAFLMLFTLIAAGEINGSKRWLDLGVFALQPSEFAKPGFVVAAAWMLAEGARDPKFPGGALAMGLYAIVAMLLLMQPDFGQWALITAVWAVMFFVAGWSWLWIALLAVIGVGALAAGYLLSSHVAARIDGFLKPGAQETYQVDRALETIANGGLIGRGDASPVKNSLPDAHTDFIFAVAGEEFGFVLCALIIILFAIFVARTFSLAATLRSMFARCAVVGLAAIIGLQAIINIGVSLRALPAKGMTLPFISYGGSSLLATGLTVGLIVAFDPNASRRLAAQGHHAVTVTTSDQPVVLAAGGTGGHMFPAEALAQELKRRGIRVLLVTDARGARYAEKFPADDRFQISAATPSIGGPVAKGMAAVSLAQGLFTALRQFKKCRPAAAIGFGGYPSLPAMKAASLLGIPYGVHEQNGVLGRANRMLVRGAVFAAHGFSVLEKAPKNINRIEVGNPVRDAVAAVSDTPFSPVGSAGDINILVFGGSQGASIFSAVPIKAITELPLEIRQRLRVTHQAREKEIASVRSGYQEAGVRCEIATFFADLPQRMAAAHLVISRAGASTVTELSAIGRPSILVPLAIAMDDHQSGNARALSDAGAAIMLPERAFTQEALSAALAPLLAQPARLEEMASAAKGRVKSGAAAALADLVEDIITARVAA